MKFDCNDFFFCKFFSAERMKQSCFTSLNYWSNKFTE